MTSMISSWSMSRLDVYESCPYRAYLQYVEKIPQPPPSDAMARGTRIHEAAEAYVTRDVELILELQNFDFADLRSLYVNNRAACIIESEWAFNEVWQNTAWSSETAWGRLKLDFGYVDGTHARIVDYKTGKKYPAKHIQQGQLYSIVTFLRYPLLETVHTEFWYIDQGDKLEKDYTRMQATMLKDDFDLRARTMTTAKNFPPRSSAYACNFCPYGEKGNKHCDYRYSA